MTKSLSKIELQEQLLALVDKGRLEVRVTANARENAVVVPPPSTDSCVQVKVTKTPEKGKANAAVIKLLAKALGLPKSSLSIIRGEKSRDKLVQIDAKRG